MCFITFTAVDVNTNETQNGENIENANEIEVEIVGGAEGGEDEYEEYYSEEDIADRVTTEDAKDGNGDNPDFEIEENAFGKKIRKRKKKMETRLLKEILNDVKVSSKRY